MRVLKDAFQRILININIPPQAAVDIRFFSRLLLRNHYWI
jgi:hypothetical protein